MKEVNQSERMSGVDRQSGLLSAKQPKKIAKYRKQFLSRAFFKLELMSSKNKSFQ